MLLRSTALACLLAAQVLPGSVAADCGALGRPIVTEVFYDATGDDTGFEFVELLNPTGEPWPLAMVRLESGDGSAPDRWTLRWTGGRADTVRPHARFVIGGARLDPPPDVLAALDLQNGPDAVRLVWPDGTIEVVGYGAHEFAQYACGAPAADVASGQSLARIPDTARFGSNALDFRAAAPSPGRANQPGRDAAVVLRSLAIDPMQPLPGEATRARIAVASRGATPFAAGEVALELLAQGVLLAARVLETPLAAETVHVEIELAFPGAGKFTLVARMNAALDEDASNNADSIAVRVGAGPLEVTEIQFHPARDEGEWVEVRNRAPDEIDLAEFLLGDRGGARGSVRAPLGGAWLGSDRFAVLVQDRPRFLAAYPGLDTTRVLAVSPWAALNNSDDASGVADIVKLAERDGTPCASVPYRGSGVADGVPLERRADGSWGPGSAPTGTPLAAPRAFPALPRAFVVAPRRVHGTTVTQIEWALPWPARIEVTVYDLAGRRVAVALAPHESAARGARSWPVTSLGPGLYVLALHARAKSGAALDATQPLRVIGNEP